MSTQHRPTRAVVIGGSMAGLATARVLADHVDEVTVLERERLVDVAEPRGHIPQGRHVHALLDSGLDRLEGWFPGLTASLHRQGALLIDGTNTIWHQAGGYRVQGWWGGQAVTMTRPLLETEIRCRVRALERVTIEDGVRVDGLLIVDGRVTGVVAQGEERAADLVVDCSGRNSRIAHDLADRGVLVPLLSRVVVDIGYTTRMFRRRPGDVPGSCVVIAATPPLSVRGGIALGVEGDRWQVTLAGMHGDVPPDDPDAWAAFARSLPSPVIGDLIANCEAMGALTTYRYPSSQRRHYERVRNLLPGFVTLGDALSSFNPVYGQGMSVAALQAEALGEVLATRGLDDPRLPADFHRRAAKIVDIPWSIAAGADFLHPQTTGPKPPGTDVLNRYVREVVRASHTSLPVAEELMQVQSLKQPPSSLMRPRMFVTVLRAARRSPAVTGAPVVHPTRPEPSTVVT